MLALLWLMFTARLITAAILDCGYVANPIVTIKGVKLPQYFGAIHLNVCSSVYINIFNSENAFQFSCDSSKIIIHVWNGKECDDDPIIDDNSVQTSEFNCDSQNECEYIHTKLITYNTDETDCNSPNFVSAFETAFITDICVTISSSQSAKYTSCDLSGAATLSQFSNTDCTGTPRSITELPSEGNCNADSTPLWLQAICPTTDNPTTNNPTTNTPTTNNPTTNNPTTNNPTNHPTSHPT
eukprot:86149_1